MSEDGLFDSEPVRYRELDHVVVTTIWGEEVGQVRRAYHDPDGYPLIEVALQRGDTITISPARVKPVAE